MQYPTLTLLAFSRLVNYYFHMRYLIPVALLLTACSSAEKRAAKYDADMQTWKGGKIQEVIGRMGAPTRSMKLDGGETLYVWEKASQSASYTRIPGSNTVDQDVQVLSCSVTFTTRKDLIEAVSWHGNACY
jgi:hypothetical protein